MNPMPDRTGDVFEGALIEKVRGVMKGGAVVVDRTRA
jgi:hypothetical protein